MSQMFQYEVWSPSASDKLYTVVDFYGDFYTTPCCILSSTWILVVSVYQI